MKHTPLHFSQFSTPMFYILLSVVAKERHGYDIMKTVKEESKGAVTIGPGTLYGIIKRLLEDGYIVESGGDERRRFYRATTKGTETVVSELNRYSQVLDTAKKAGIYKKLHEA